MLNGKVGKAVLGLAALLVAGALVGIAVREGLVWLTQHPIEFQDPEPVGAVPCCPCP